MKISFLHFFGSVSFRHRYAYQCGSHFPKRFSLPHRFDMINSIPLLLKGMNLIILVGVYPESLALINLTLDESLFSYFEIFLNYRARVIFGSF